MFDANKAEKTFKRAWAKMTNPSGLVEIEHSEKCEAQIRKWDAKAKKFDSFPCICRMRSRRPTLTKLLQSKEWRGSSVTTDGDYHVLRHPTSNAVVRIKVVA